MSGEQREQRDEPTTFVDTAHADERTVQRAAERDAQREQTQRRSARRSKRATVETTRPRLANVDRPADPDVWKQAWATALRLANGDASRVVRERDAFVVRNPRHERSTR